MNIKLRLKVGDKFDLDGVNVTVTEELIKDNPNLFYHTEDMLYKAETLKNNKANYKKAINWYRDGTIILDHRGAFCICVGKPKLTHLTSSNNSNQICINVKYNDCDTETEVVYIYGYNGWATLPETRRVGYSVDSKHLSYGDTCYCFMKEICNDDIEVRFANKDCDIKGNKYFSGLYVSKIEATKALYQYRLDNFNSIHDFITLEYLRSDDIHKEWLVVDSNSKYSSDMRIRTKYKDEKMPYTYIDDAHKYLGLKVREIYTGVESIIEHVEGQSDLDNYFNNYDTIDYKYVGKFEWQ